ncbi:MAG: murein transglycosylase A [Acetobacteraceae bacterium]|jgi:membrane-bound lytic murein transglycosylase A|nr:murein transglycosylase A [Acetobacteraceae bacterium]
MRHVWGARWARPFVLAAALFAAGCVAVPVPQPPPPADRLSLTPMSFSALPGWAEERHAEILPAFGETCRRLAALPAERQLGGAEAAAPRAGRVSDWLPLCAEAARLPPGDHAATRAFFEARFRPWLAQNVAGSQPDPFGLFTGYFEPEVPGSRRRRPGGTPLLTRPADLVQVELGDFAEDLRGRRTAGRVEQGRLIPYASRSEIERGALDGRRLELVWLDDPIDAFFLHIQGSGRVRLAEGGIARVGFAGQNGHPYVPIGRVLVDRGVMTQDQVSMQSVRAWLEANPAQAREVMNQNPSYIFFREIRGLGPEEGPPGAFGAPLTPERSIAVDRSFIPLGIPVFIDVPHPLTNAPYRRVLMAQDIGGAIRGPVRGDVFWGTGAAAGEAAGRMRSRGTWWLLLPAGLGG